MRSNLNFPSPPTLMRAVLHGLCAMALLTSTHTVKAQKPSHSGTATPCAKAPTRMVCVKGGTYIRGSNRNQHHPNWKFRAESPRHKVTLNTFYIDQYEVTNEEFVACIRAGHCGLPSYWAPTWSSMRPRFRSRKRPFVRATWILARDYCKWAGKRLLTEAEWEAAARGPKGDTYPWGNSAPDCTKANYRVFPPHTSYPKYARMRFCAPPTNKSRKPIPHGQDQTWEVGKTPAFRGIYDMAGNGYEWVQDLYDPHAYGGCDDPNSKYCERNNPRGPCGGTKATCTVKVKHRWLWKRTRIKVGNKRVWRWKRVLRTFKRPRRKRYTRHILKGGSWWWYADHMRSAWRRSSRIQTGSHRLSIRCGSSQATLRSKPAPKKLSARAKLFLRKNKIKF